MAEYIREGKCIFCGRDKTSTTFHNKPHILPRSMGGEIVGEDVCDDCNHFFGTPLKGLPGSIEEAIKDIFGVSRHFMLLTTKYNNAPPPKFILRSRWFEYKHSKKKLRLKQQMLLNRQLRINATTLFRRGLYEVFLQSLHNYGISANNDAFNYARRFARYGEGDMPVFFLVNRGIYLIDTETLEHPEIRFSEDIINDIVEYGFFTFIIHGHILVLTVTPTSKEKFVAFMEKRFTGLCSPEGFYPGFKLLTDFSEMDFDLRSMRNNGGIAKPNTTQLLQMLNTINFI